MQTVRGKEMTIQLDKYKASCAIKDEIIERLKAKPMSYRELWAFYKVHKTQMSSYIISLKNFNLIESRGKGSRDPNSVYHYIGKTNFTDALTERLEINNKMRKSNKKNTSDDIRFSLNASMKVHSNKYHTTGNKGKISSWQGYTSFEGL